MPLVFYKKIDHRNSLGVWQITESESWFREQLVLIAEEKTELQQLKSSGKRKEWLAARWLLHYLGNAQSREPCLKNAFGKPFVEDPKTEISISHSHGFAAVIRSSDPVGIDIQKRVPKILGIEKKFINENEASWIREQHRVEDIHLVWGAKEALYKTYSKKKVDFSRELEVSKPNFEANQTVGVIKKEKEKRYEVHYKWLDSYLLVYCLPKNA
jgi:4'-phosphopantetheinyl transferase EntD